MNDFALKPMLTGSMALIFRKSSYRTDREIVRCLRVQRFFRSLEFRKFHPRDVLLRASARDVIVWKEFYFDSLEFLCSVYERLSVRLCEDIIVIESYREL